MGLGFYLVGFFLYFWMERGCSFSILFGDGDILGVIEPWFIGNENHFFSRFNKYRKKVIIIHKLTSSLYFLTLSPFCETQGK